MDALVGQAGAEDVTETLFENARTCDEGAVAGVDDPLGRPATRLALVCRSTAAGDERPEEGLHGLTYPANHHHDGQGSSRNELQSEAASIGIYVHEAPGG